MRPEVTEPYASPLESVLVSLPEGEPPADLERRCLGVLRDLDSRARFARPRIAWKPVVLAAAAGLAISLLGVSSLQSLLPARPEAERGSARESLSALEAPAPLTESEAPRDAFRGGTAREVDATTSLPAAPAAAAKGVNAAAPAVPPAATAAPQANPEKPKSPPVAGLRYAREAAGDSLNSLEPGGPASRSPAPVLIAPSPYPVPPTSGPERPWYDSSPERQKIVRAVLSLLVKDVQRAYDEARSTIEKAKGYVQEDDLRLEQGSKREARISARVPVDRLEGVLAQLRDLGEVTLLKTEAQDATREYRGQGAHIREMGATEDELVRRYEAAKDRETRRRLYAQIMELRARNRAAKGSLQQLSDKTHLAFLELTLTEKNTPLKFLGSVGGHMTVALGWVAATAILWLPLLVLGLVWLRRGRPASG